MLEKADLDCLTSKDLELFGKNAFDDLSGKRFQQGKPITIERDGITLRLYPDGRTQTIPEQNNTPAD